jgi:competence protein ComEC
VHDDAPAALPLLSFVAALALAPVLVNPRSAVVGCVGMALVCALRHRRAALVAACAIAGLVIGMRPEARPAVKPDRFVIVEAALDRDWSAQPHYYVLRVNSFRVDGIDITAPLAIYTRFAPRIIHDEELIRVEGFLRLDERGRYAISVKSPRLLSYHGRLSRWSPAAWNRFAANRLRRHAATHPAEVAMIEALVLGRGERLTQETRDQYKRGGTYHLLVFSGLQISLAAGAIALVLRWFGAARASDGSLLAFAVIAPLFIGPTASVSRASAGIALYAMSRLLARPTSFENLWCIAALARLALTPSDLTDPAFHLTYAGAGALLFIGKPLARSRLRWIAYAAAAEIAIAPLTLFHFNQYALGGSLMTIVMTPIVFLMLIAGAIFCVTELAFLLPVISVLNRLCTLLNDAASPLSGFFAPPPIPFLAVGLTGAIAAIAFLRGARRTVAITCALLLPAAAAWTLFDRRGEVVSPEVTFLDVGQGDAILIRSGSHAALVDGGPYNANLPAVLAERGVRRLDFAVLSHAHPDHCGGLIAVLRHVEVGELWITPQRFRGECAQRILERAPRIRLIRDHHVRRLGDFRIEAFAPRRRYRRNPENNSSVVIRAVADSRAVLLTGDIEREAETDLAPILTPADVVKVPHHGSRTSTSAALLDSVRPRIAVISCGRRNFFGHPHPAVVAALKSSSARILRTDTGGGIRITIRSRRLFVTSEIDTQH